jgi:hypothetical protein
MILALYLLMIGQYEFDPSYSMKIFSELHEVCHTGDILTMGQGGRVQRGWYSCRNRRWVKITYEEYERERNKPVKRRFPRPAKKPIPIEDNIFIEGWGPFGGPWKWKPSIERMWSPGGQWAYMRELAKVMP